MLFPFDIQFKIPQLVLSEEKVICYQLELRK